MAPLIETFGSSSGRNYGEFINLGGGSYNSGSSQSSSVGVTGNGSITIKKFS